MPPESAKPISASLDVAEHGRASSRGGSAVEPPATTAGETVVAASPTDVADAVEEALEKAIRVRSRMLTGLFTLAVFYTFYFAKAVLIPIALAMLLNLLLAPLVRGLRKYLRLPEGFGAALVLLLGVGIVAGAIYGLSGPTTRWLDELPLAMIDLREKVEELRRPVAEVQEAAQKVENLAQGEPKPGEPQPVQVAVQGPGLTQLFLGGAVTFVAASVVMIALLFFLLASGDTLLRQAVSIAPRLSDKRRVVEIARDTEDDISYYLLTISLINAGLGLAVGVMMYVLGMPNAILWGVMAGIFNFVPFLGAVVGIAIVGLVALLTFDQLWSILLPPLSYLVLTSVEAQFVTPALLARRLTLNPVAVFLALIVWTWLWGVAGALLAVPLLATFKICCDHIEPLQPIGTMLGR
ncbi:MAG TPA: AI-2E family transporter [Geminicoccaceae bacterium]|nr:AI-2E family transporter [Geminicoccaceae bacterium]